MKKALALTLVFSMILVLVSCAASSAPAASSAAPSPASQPASSAAPAKTAIMTIGTADTGGTMYPVGSTIAKVINDNVPGVKINVETSAGSPDNARNLQGGQIDLGMISGDVAYESFNGIGKFADAKAPDIRVLSGTYPSLSNWMVLDSSGIEYVHELNGKKCAVGMTASTTEISARIAIEAAGIAYPDGVSAQFIGLGEGAEAVRDGVADATHGFAGVPIGGQLDLSNTKPAHLLKYTEEHLDKVIAANGSYYKTVIPAGTYKNQAEDVPTFGVKCLVCVNVKLDDEMAYQMAKALHTHPNDLIAGHASMKAMSDPKFMCTNLPIPLHPGAEKYYKEAGLLA